MATMYCPQCATPNADGARFCRSCGMELEAVALMLRERLAQPTEVSGTKSESKTSQDWLENRSKGVKSISTGVSLLIVSILIGVAMAFFVPPNIPWILAWAVLVGWMAMWGGVELGNGIAGVLEAKNRLRFLGLAVRESGVDTTPRELSSAESEIISKRSSSPSSVTEGTTRHLDDLVEK